MPLSILYEDNHLLVLNKPAGLATMGVTEDRESLVQLAKDDLKRRFNKPGNVYLGVVSRLDSTVSGVIVLARTSKAASRLNDQFKSRDVEKVYWAIVSGKPPQSGECVDRLWHDDRAQCVKVVDAQHAGAQEARLSFRRLQPITRGTWLEVQLHTGRKHQIRVQLAERGWPVWGDKKYGSRESFAAGIALHARRLAIDHPTRDERMEFIAPVPASWKSFGVTNG